MLDGMDSTTEDTGIGITAGAGRDVSIVVDQSPHLDTIDLDIDAGGQLIGRLSPDGDEGPITGEQLRALQLDDVITVTVTGRVVGISYTNTNPSPPVFETPPEPDVSTPA